jgi:four helix bundle protein
MAKIERFEDLECWKSARELVCQIYLLCQKGPLAKDYDFQSQLKRASLSIMNNIAEGFSRFNKKDFIRFLDYSQSSPGEVKSMLYILTDIEYVPSSVIAPLHSKTDKVGNLTLGLISYLTNNNKKSG